MNARGVLSGVMHRHVGDSAIMKASAFDFRINHGHGQVCSFPITFLPLLTVIDNILLCNLCRSMLGRINQVVRHLSRPLPNLAHNSAATFRSSITSSTMAGATARSSQKSLIHTAACLIIGDEVLGGKVC